MRRSIETQSFVKHSMGMVGLRLDRFPQIIGLLIPRRQLLSSIAHLHVVFQAATYVLPVWYRRILFTSESLWRSDSNSLARLLTWMFKKRRKKKSCGSRETTTTTPSYLTSQAGPLCSARTAHSTRKSRSCPSREVANSSTSLSNESSPRRPTWHIAQESHRF